MNRYARSHHHRLHEHPHRGHPRQHGGARRGARGKGQCREATFRRRFFSRDEHIAGLEQYLNDLRAEAEAVEEKLVGLRAAG